MLEAILNRRSVRFYRDTPVSDADVEEVLKAGFCAPTGHNERAWHVIVVRDQAVKDAISGLHQWYKILARVPVVLDGFVTAAAALVAARLAPRAVDAMIAGHRSPEPGHALVLDELGLEPLLDLGLRLGEGSGAALALPIVDAALALMREMASFADAGVTDSGR